MEMEERRREKTTHDMISNVIARVLCRAAPRASSSSMWRMCENRKAILSAISCGLYCCTLCTRCTCKVNFPLLLPHTRTLLFYSSRRSQVLSSYRKKHKLFCYDVCMCVRFAASASPRMDLCRLQLDYTYVANGRKKYFHETSIKYL